MHSQRWVAPMLRSQVIMWGQLCSARRDCIYIGSRGPHCAQARCESYPAPPTTGRRSDVRQAHHSAFMTQQLSWACSTMPMAALCLGVSPAGGEARRWMTRCARGTRRWSSCSKGAELTRAARSSPQMHASPPPEKLYTTLLQSARISRSEDEWLGVLSRCG